MRKLQLKATELVDTDVNFVSLVERGANRIPFRITKEDEQMLDLHKIGRSLFRKAEPKPEIVAVIAQKGADPAQDARGDQGGRPRRRPNSPPPRRTAS